MTQDEIIEMARQADIKHRTNIFYSQFCDGVYADDLEAFAKLVAAKEREECAKVCEGMPLEWQAQPQFARIELLTARDCAAAIRARGEA